MLTISQAQTIPYRAVLEHATEKNADRTPMRVRVNGGCKTWKTRPGEFSLPVKHGLKTCGYITHETAHLWTVEV